MLLDKQQLQSQNKRIEELKVLREKPLIESGADESDGVLPDKKWLMMFEQKVRANNLLFEMMRVQ